MQMTNPKYAASAAVLLIGVFAAGPASAQSFSSGSTGADGALNLTTPGTVVFDPRSFSPALDPSGDNVFNFTTINIAAGVTVKLQGNILNGPITWLATGNVTINGTIDLSGQPGVVLGTGVKRAPAVPGSGGYGGGIGAFNGNPATAGFGPTGGALACNSGSQSCGGGSTGNQFLVPLVGGSGGGADSGGGGGAGGGAILIASNTSITVNGSIVSIGGNGAYPGGNVIPGAGGGGAIRLVSNAISLTGSSLLNVSGGTTPPFGSGIFNGSLGTVRLEGFQISPLGTITGNLYSGTPFGVFLNSTGPAISVVSVGGVAVATSPTGTFTMPDVTVNSSGALTAAIQAQNVPAGTVVTLLVYSENGPDQTIQSTGLAGTLASSNATAQVTLPPGFSLGLIKATWTQ